MMNEMDIFVQRPGALTQDELSAWRAFQASDPALASPYFHPEFSLAADRVRRDVRVATVRKGGEIQGFLPFQTGPLGCGRPVGGPLSDFHGLIAAPDTALDINAIARRAGLSLFGYHFVPASQTRHGLQPVSQDDCHVIGLEEGYDRYRSLPQLSTSAFKTLDNRRRRIQRDFGRMDVVIDDRSDAAFQTLLDWKKAQFAATGYFDVFSVAWTRALLHDLRAPRADGFGGLLSSLYIDGRLAAVHFGIRTTGTLHYWFPAYDPEFSRYSVGNILLDELARASGTQGWTAIHLGPGDYRYKLEFASRRTPVVAGVLRTPSICGAIHQALHAAAGGLARVGLDGVSRLPGKALRRLDHMAGFRIGAL